MNGLALSGFLDGQRLARKDALALTKERRIAEQHPLDMLALQQQNYQRDLQNQQTAAMNPLTLEQQKQGNYARDLANYQNYQLSPMQVEQQRQLNAKRGLELQSAQQLTPTENALALQKMQADMQLSPMQVEQQRQLNAKRGLELQSAQQTQPSTNALALQMTRDDLHERALQSGVKAYQATGDISPLKQSIAAAYGGNVKLDQLPDGSVQVQGAGGVKRFDSMNAFITAVSGAETPKPLAPMNMGNGWIYDPNTKQGTQLYQEAPKVEKPAELPVDGLALNSMTATYLKDQGLALSNNDRALLVADMKARAAGLMRDGADPSVAVREAYKSVVPGLSESRPSLGEMALNPIGAVLNSGVRYDPAALSLSGSGAPAPATSAGSAPASAINYLKQNNTPEVRAMFEQKYGYLP
ncbi:hypothetical protein [Thiothrix winogradskyi]|uniref:Uncharacterized protein n=1 Tax=Thiothrix winogradskyi TaxID=96472 RepID=A0ABY3T6Z2_9GAMM|nr:hypothetical protein [Thiothrix winogradskyi]UJS26291.1 hypothetical protein L2Y54_09690 [Thiothrix winogradskyi]